MYLWILRLFNTLLDEVCARVIVEEPVLEMQERNRDICVSEEHSSVEQ